MRSILLRDFGLYAGAATIDLVPRMKGASMAPVVLIGGKNGAGKTTLLEAVRLALYGRRALGPRVSRAEYDDYLREHVNRRPGSDAAAVGLEFDYAEAGTVHRYSVLREWAIRGKSVVETLELLKDCAPVKTVPREEWQSFLQELVPPGVSQLFFFDGEKISEIAEGVDDDQLAEAIRGLLGIELIGRLRVDLGLYIARQQQGDVSELSVHIETISRDIEVEGRRAADLADHIAELRTERDSRARTSEHVRRQFVAEGGDAAVRRDRLELQLEASKRELSRATHDLKDLATGLLPFAMAPKLASALGALLRRPPSGTELGASVDQLARAIAHWREKSEPARQGKWQSAHWKDLQAFLDEQRQGKAMPTHSATREVGDGAAALQRLDELEGRTRARVVGLLQEMDELSAREAELRIAISRADNASAGLLLDELQLADRRLGKAEEVLRAREEEWKASRGRLVTLDREQRRLLEQQATAELVRRRATLAANASQAISAFENRLLDEKLEQLRREFVSCFNLLARKESFIVDVKFDRSTFATTLVDRNGQTTTKAALSAGEKQIYAIALLWALAKTSGRPLPMIVDTPLARLDSDHRAKLVEQYFSRASHQVIVLSTDTEVDDELFARMGPSVSHSYRLEFDDVSGSTKVYPGYFAETKQSKGHERALQQA